MELSLFIVTYKGFERLTQTLDSLFDSDLSPIDLKVYVINNHTDFRLKSKYKDKVRVLHNNLRPDWSNGHLSRNWNQALLHGFKDLQEPDADIVVAVQDDTLFQPEWASRLLELHEKYTLVQNGQGDQLVSYRPEAVRRIGLWDERFVFSFHAADYFYRALMYNPEQTTLNDPHHKRIWNPVFPEDTEDSANYLVDAEPRKIDEGWDQSSISVRLGQELMKQKYGSTDFEELKENPHRASNLQNYVFYPYFEKDVYNLAEKNYLWKDAWGDDEGEADDILEEQIDIILRATRGSAVKSLEKLGIKEEVKHIREAIRRR